MGSMNWTITDVMTKARSMKKLLIVFLALSLLLCGCKSSGKKVTLILTCFDYNIVQELTEEEAAEVIRIFNSKKLQPLFTIPSCGFSKNVAIRVGLTTYQIASDHCESLCVGLLYYSISEEDMAYIHGLFEKYSGAQWGFI